MRYSELRRLSNDVLTAHTDGYQTDYGGAFDHYITKYEEEGYLKRDKKSPRKTFIIPNIPKIEDLLDRKRLKNSLDRMELVRSEVAKPLFPEELLLGGGFLIPDDSNLDDFDLQNTVPLFFFPWKIYAASDKGKNFHLTEQDVQELLRIGKTIASKDKTRRFKIILEYEGSS
jgi:hypothetical protein